MSLVVRLAGLLTGAFYRHVHLGGAIPREGPLLVVANHTHQLVDVALALRAIDRRTTLLAKATLFRAPPMSWLVQNAHALPVHRARDGARDDAAKRETAASLDAAAAALARGGCVLLFPEGVSHDEPGIYRAHSGAARIAVDALARGASALRIVPLGLLYRAKGRPRSEAATLVGADIDGRDVDVDALTARIEEALRDVTLHLEQWEDLPLVQAATALDDALVADDTTDALATLADGIARLRAREPATLARVRRRVDLHARRLRRIGVRPDEGARSTSQHAVVAAGRHALGVVIAPFMALAGVITRRPALVDRARRLVRAAVDFVRLVAAGHFAARIASERGALLHEIQTLLRASQQISSKRGSSPLTNSGAR
jgi:glycerol-3-phosphate O-acyltransferase/dihydroxyacetone phosphate acyltransferase